MTSLDTANAFLRRGWQPVPIPHGSKKPTLPGWQKLRTTQDESANYFNGVPSNIGVLLGTPSGGLVDVDLDCAEAIALAPHFLKATATFGRESKRCSHYLFVATRLVPERTTKYQSATRETIVELRSTGGQTLFPGSVHPSGEPIEWSSKSKPPLEVDGSDLERHVLCLAVAALVSRSWPRAAGVRHDLALALANSLTTGGLLPEEIENIIGVAALHAGDEEAQERGKQAYQVRQNGLSSGWPTVAKFAGNDTADTLRRWLGLWGSDYAQPELTPASHTATPESPVFPSKDLSSEKTLQRAAPDPALLVSRFLNGAARQSNPVEKPKSVIDWLVYFQGVTLLLGAPKLSGKTWFLLHGISAYQKGAQQFVGGRIEEEPAPVVYLSELDRTTFESEYLAAPSIDLRSSDLFYSLHRGDDFGFTTPQVLDAAREVSQRVNARLLVVDTFSHWFSLEDENGAAEVQRALRPLLDLTSIGLSVVVVHHTRKGGGDTVEAGRGSSAFAGAVDMIANLQRPSGNFGRNVRLLSCEGRFAAIPAERYIEYDEQNGYTLLGTEKDVLRSRAREELADSLPTNEGDAQSIKEVAETVDMSVPTVRRALGELLAEGLVCRLGEGKSGDPYRYHKSTVMSFQ